MPACRCVRQVSMIGKARKPEGAQGAQFGKLIVNALGSKFLFSI